MSYYFGVSFRFNLVSEFSVFIILIYDVMMISSKIFIVLLLLNLICLLSAFILELVLSAFHLNSRIKVLHEIINAISWDFLIYFFFPLQTLKIMILPKGLLVTVRLIFFRLWISISDVCICKAFHWYNCTFMNDKWQTYFWVFFCLFCHHMHVCNMLYCQLAVLMYEPENTGSTSWRKCFGGQVENLNYNIYCRGILAFHR